MVDLSLIRPQHLWYIIGFIATDGSLSKDGRHIALVSKDERLLFDIRGALHLSNKVGKKARGGSQDKIYSVLQIGDKRFYEYLLAIGLVPRKSLVLGPLEIPSVYFTDFLRGVIDGDGSISGWLHRTNRNQQWSLRIVSGSEKFIKWLKTEIEGRFKVRGKMYGYRRPGKKNFLYQVKFGKFATKVILVKCYYKDCLALERKREAAKKCLVAEDGLSKYGNVVQFTPRWRNWQTRLT